MSDKCKRHHPTRGRWAASALFALAGVAFAAAQLAGGQTASSAVGTLVLFEAVAVLLGLGGGSESIRAFRGDLRDERLDEIEIRAVAFAGRLLLVALVVADIVQTIRGTNDPYGWLLAIGGAAYIGYYIVALRR
jgi:hypothetical protein